MYTIGLDVGSTSIKANIYDMKGNFCSGASRSTPLSHNDPLHPDRCVWQPSEVWQNALESLTEAVSVIEDKENIKGITCTGFGFDGVPLDRERKELYPFISWHCPRTEPILEELSKKFDTKDIFYRTGKTPWAIDPVYRLHWLKRNEPRIYEKIDKYLIIVDYLVYKLTGEIVCDQTTALSTSVFNINTLDWDKELIRRLELPEHIWCDHKPSGSVVGTITPEVAKITELPINTIVTLGGHDFSTASVALGVIEEGTVLDMAGTWEMISAPTRTINLSDSLMESGIYMDVHSISGLYQYVCAMVSGDMTEWLKTNLYSGNSKDSKIIWDEISNIAGAAKLGSEGCFFLPLFSGSVNDHKDLGAFVGMSNNVTKNEMIRAVFEGLNYLILETLNTMDDMLTIKNMRMIVSGGAAKNSFWMQNKADITGLEIETANVYEATTLGGALVAAIGAGVFKNAKEAYDATKKPGKIFEPDIKAHERYSELYNNVYKKLKPTLKDINHSIYDLK
jgi:sugar (pentulose or hexulose) kinase